jgi:dephospho-CoA kinase
MLILGLTGSIGMGKSTTAQLFKQYKIPVFDADATVHRLQLPGQAGFKAIAQAFPEVIKQGKIDRQSLGQLVFANPMLRQKLEALLHPLVRQAQQRWLAIQARQRARPALRKIVVLDIPLLFETGGWQGCDGIVVVDAPTFIQRQRVLARPGMNPLKFKHIIQSQTPQRIRKRCADFVLPTGQGKALTRAHVYLLIKRLSKGARYKPDQGKAGHKPLFARVWGRKAGWLRARAFYSQMMAFRGLRNRG